MNADPSRPDERSASPARDPRNPAFASDEARSRARWPLTVAAVLLTLLLLFAVAWSALRWQNQMRTTPAPATSQTAEPDPATPVRF